MKLKRRTTLFSLFVMSALILGTLTFGLSVQPAAAEVIDGVTCTLYHTVQSGETLWGISQKYGVDWQEVARINQLDNPRLIYSGNRICVQWTTNDGGGNVIIPETGSQAAFSILYVRQDDYVTIKASGFPSNTTLNALIGPASTRGINGIQVDTIRTGNGNFQKTFDIPNRLKGESRLALRLFDPQTSFVIYGTFLNQTGTPAGGGIIPITGASANIDFTRVQRNDFVTVSASGFPSNLTLDVYMGPAATRGINGVQVDTITTGNGSFQETFDIPNSLRNEDRIAVRMVDPSTGFTVYQIFKNGQQVVSVPNLENNRTHVRTVNLSDGQRLDVAIGEGGVFMPNSAFDGSMKLARIDRSAFSPDLNLNFTQEVMEVRFLDQNGTEIPQIYGIVYVYFNLDEQSLKDWQNNDLNIYHYNTDEKLWNPCKYQMRIQSENRPYGRLACVITDPGLYAPAAQ